MKTNTQKKLINKTKSEIAVLEGLLKRNEALQLETPGMENLVKNHAYWSKRVREKKLYLESLGQPVSRWPGRVGR